MWPWEHLAFGYVLYSLLGRARGRPVRPAAALAVAFATQLPDLIDKPLAWVVGVLPSGTSLGHSLLFALLLAIAATILAPRAGVDDAGVAFAVGYFSHLVGDILYPVFLGGPPAVEVILWPFVPASYSEIPAIEKIWRLIVKYWRFLRTPQAAAYIVFEVALLASSFILWLRDGTPGLPARKRSDEDS